MPQFTALVVTTSGTRKRVTNALREFTKQTESKHRTAWSAQRELQVFQTAAVQQEEIARDRRLHGCQARQTRASHRRQCALRRTLHEATVINRVRTTKPTKTNWIWDKDHVAQVGTRNTWTWKCTENAKVPSLACQRKPALDRQGRQARSGPFPIPTCQLSTLIRTLHFVWGEFKWLFEHVDTWSTTCWWSPFDFLRCPNDTHCSIARCQFWAGPLCVRAAKPYFPCHPKVRWACSCRQTESTSWRKEAPMLHTTNGVNVDWSGMLLCKTVDGHVPSKKLWELSEQLLADCAQNKQATIFQHCRHEAIDQRASMHTTGFQILPQRQRGNNTHRRPSTTTTHGHTRTNTRKPTGNGWSGGWSGQNRNYW